MFRRNSKRNSIIQSFRTDECGLCDVSKQAPVPLKSVNVTANVVHTVAQVEIVQVYKNKKKIPIEVTYGFPLDFTGAVTHFHAELGDQIVKGVVKPNEEAMEDYADAIQEGTTAFLGQHITNMFMVHIGYLKPKTTAKIVIGYTTELFNEDWDKNVQRLCIPATAMASFIPPTVSDSKWDSLKRQSSSTPFPLSIRIVLSSRDEIKKVRSPTHRILMTKSESEAVNEKVENSWHKIVIELTGQKTTLELYRDFVLLIKLNGDHTPRLYSERHCTSLALMAHLIPSFALGQQKVELIIVLDRSYSMTGQNFAIAKKAVKLLLNSFPSDCYFNMIGVGSSFEFCFHISVRCHDQTIQMAKRLSEHWRADFGQSNLYGALDAVFAQRNIPGYLRQIILITDGHVQNAEGVIDLVKVKSIEMDSRLFCLVIGDNSPYALVKSLTQAGRGTSAFVIRNELIDEKVLQLLTHAIMPPLKDVQVEWHGKLPQIQIVQSVRPTIPKICREMTLLGFGKPTRNETDVRAKDKWYAQAPEKISFVHDGEQLLIFGVFENFIQEETRTGITIKANTRYGPLSVYIPLTEKDDMGLTEMLHKLAAIKIVREFERKLETLQFRGPTSWSEMKEMKDHLKQKIIDIAVAQGFASTYTSFIAVDSSNNKKIDQKLFNILHAQEKMPSQNVFADERVELYSKSRPSLWENKNRDVRNAELRMKSCLPTRSEKLSSEDVLDMSICMNKTSIENPNRMTYTTLADMKEYAAFLPPPQDEQPISSGKHEIQEKEENSCTKVQIDDLLKNILNLASPNGFYHLSDHLLKLLGLELVVVNKSLEWSDIQWATALVLMFFQVKMVDRKDEWKSIDDKARQWLRTELEDIKFKIRFFVILGQDN